MNVSLNIPPLILMQTCKRFCQSMRKVPFCSVIILHTVMIHSWRSLQTYETYVSKSFIHRRSVTHPLLGSRAIPLGWVMFSFSRTILLSPFSWATSITLSLESNQYKFPPIQSYASPSTRSKPFDMTWNNENICEVWDAHDGDYKAFWDVSIRYPHADLKIEAAGFY